MTIIIEGGAEQMTYRFREAREKAGLSTLEVAKRIGVSQPAVTYWDNGTKPPSIETLCKLADLYCVSTDYLLGRDEPMESIPRKEDVIATETLRALTESQYGTRIKAGASSIAFMITSSSWTAPRLFWRKL